MLLEVATEEGEVAEIIVPGNLFGRLLLGV